MKHTLRFGLVSTLLCSMLVTGCMQQTAGPDGSAVSFHPMEQMNQKLQANTRNDWYTNTYEIFPYSYCDSNGDGIGDLAGITKQIPYVEALGFQNIWLTPVQKASSYHKYDVEDYYTIDPEFGTMEDFEILLDTLHAKDMKYIMDLVINHTSNRHPWFTQAVSYLQEHNVWDEEQCPYLTYYNFSDVFQTGYTKVEGTDWYYESRFSDTMPDLNLDSPLVQKEIEDIIAFWLAKGVDGFRLDAVTSYDTGNPEKNTEILSWIDSIVKEKKADAYVVAEAWTAQSEYQAYYASGIDSFFDFAFAGNEGVIANTVKGVYTGSQFVHAMALEEERYQSNNPHAINAPFYTNHDMARSAGYYAKEKGEAQTKLALALNFLQTGNVFLYYGEEIGMKGSGKDENKRAPMQWGEEEGMCNGPENMDDFAMKYPSLKEQQSDAQSIWTYVQNVLRIRNAYPSIARGNTQEIETDNAQVGVMKRAYDGEEVLVCINPTDHEQTITVDGSYTLTAMLLVSEDAVSIAGNTITLPAYGIGVLE